METRDAKARAEARVLRELCRRALILLPSLAVLLAATGCSNSLFGLHGHRDDGGTGGGDDAAGVPSECSGSCIADAAADFDPMSNGGWQYLGDERSNHKWVPMTPVAKATVGDANNRIERCADNASAAACQGLTDSLLVTSSGSSSPSDPAIQYAASKAQVIQLALRAYIPSDSVEHRVRLYRNSREDVLFTAVAGPGATVMKAVTVDALAGDRFLVALEPTGTQGGTAAVQFFVIDPHTTFPSTCQLGLTFSDDSITGANVTDLCHGGFTYILNTQTSPIVVINGPYAAAGNGLHFEPGYYLFRTQPLAGKDTTTQFWVQNEAPSSQRAWVFSDVDTTTGGGTRVAFTNTSSLKLEVSAVSSTTPVTYASQSIDYTNKVWRFVRLVHANDTLTICLDGAKIASGPLPGPTAPGIMPVFGQSSTGDPTDGFFGDVDDVRVFSDALPCD